VCRQTHCGFRGLRSELDYDVNRRAEAEIQRLADNIRRMDDKNRRPHRSFALTARLNDFYR
jgi:uncharacterized membrane protein